jgi:hypothetical protein
VGDWSQTMSSKYSRRAFEAGGIYHVFNHAISDRKLFNCERDFRFFMGLIDRHLNNNPNETNIKGVPYKKLQVKVVSYCLMENHFHLQLQEFSADGGISELMKIIGAEYSQYLRKHYAWRGAIFEGRFKTVRVKTDEQNKHLTRYIHCNPRYFLNYEWSSVKYYLGKRKSSPSWLDVSLSGMSLVNYKMFLTEYDRKTKHQDGVEFCF